MMGNKRFGDFRMLRVTLVAGIVTAVLFAGSADFDRAVELYHRTDYRAALKLLKAHPENDGQTWRLIGQCYFMLTDYRKASEAFQKAVALEPNNSEFVHWLGRTWGRRAETATFLMAPVYASRARQDFERAVQLDPNNKEALNDLFDYYLEAPGFLGGGLEKAEALVTRIGQLDSAEGHYAQAQLADKQKEYDQAEAQLRRALELAPRQLGRLLDLASYLAKRGRIRESDAVFAQAETLAPDNPRILYRRAEAYIRDHRNLDQARELLKKYMSSQNLTPDDPPREKAQELLKRVDGG
jgi:tetratricopeptide (TPR) repeat protein